MAHNLAFQHYDGNKAWASKLGVCLQEIYVHAMHLLSQEIHTFLILEWPLLKENYSSKCTDVDVLYLHLFARVGLHTHIGRLPSDLLDTAIRNTKPLSCIHAVW